MRKIGIFSLLAILVFVLSFVFVRQTSENKSTKVQQPKETSKQLSNMKITSSAFSHNQTIPQKYTCDGEDLSPPLQFGEVPEDAQSLVLIVDDPDAPAKTWVHWTVFNMDPTTNEVSENSVPNGGVEAMTDFGRQGYGGPCPPSGTHRYFFKLYALDTKLALSSNADKKEIEEAMQGHILGLAELIGLYRRR